MRPGTRAVPLSPSWPIGEPVSPFDQYASAADTANTLRDVFVTTSRHFTLPMSPTFAPLNDTTETEPSIVREPLPLIGSSNPSHQQNELVAYKETRPDSGAWRVRIDSPDANGVVLYPNAIRLQARVTSALGRHWFAWSNAATPPTHDSRPFKFRVHVSNGQPAAIEVLFPRASKRRSREAKPLKFSWPQS